MADKAYIVANEQQEMAVLRIMEQQGYTWNDGDIPTHCIPSHYAQLTFPYVLTNHNFIGWLSIDDARLLNFKILYDGRKESKMKISKEVYDALVDWRKEIESSNTIYAEDINGLSSPYVVRRWWIGDDDEGTYANNRLIAIIRWVNGEDVFKVEEPKKWVVRSKGTNSAGDYVYVAINDFNFTMNTHHLNFATKFDTKEEAESWANAHQEVIEVED